MLQISERNAWSPAPNGKYFFTRNHSTLVAFAVGGEYIAGNGFTVLGAHTDSPCPKLKPNSELNKSGYVSVGVQPYGGGLWHTWFDRDLSVAGRVVVEREGALCHELVRIDRPIMRIPSLAIHLESAEERRAFAVNKQNHLAPVLAMAVDNAVNGGGGEEAKQDLLKQGGRHQPLLLELLSKQLGCAPGDIRDFELQLCDTQPSAIIGGMGDGEFVASGRLDNLCSCFQAITALLNADETLASEKNVRMVALFDHEEVGSDSAQGAGSPVMLDAMRRVTLAMGGGAEGIVERTLQASLVVSSDMAHALHPNYSDKHEPAHQPRIHGGMVIKNNANQRYATNAITGFMFRELGRRAGLPVQEFVVRSDCGCGSTIGPIISSGTGVRTVDVGSPQLSMHSIREVMGTDDVAYGVSHLQAVLEGFAALDAELQVDAR